MRVHYAPLLILLAILLSGCQASYFGLLNATHTQPGVSVQSFEYEADEQLKLDVYRSANTPADAAVLVFIYGGSWRSGERSWYRFIGEALAAEGLIVVIPDYRKYPEVQFPAFVDDAAAAIRFSRDHARSWGGDPDRLFIAGHSAGAHIALLLASDPAYLQRQAMQPGELSGAIGIAGPYDFAPIESRSLRAVFPDRNHEASTQPIHFVDGDEPPILLLHGDADKRVWPRNSERLAARLRSVDVAVELVILPGVSHSSIMKALGETGAAAVPTRALLLDFVRAHSN